MTGLDLWTDYWSDDWFTTPANADSYPEGLDDLVAEGAAPVPTCEVFRLGVKEDEVPILDGQVTESYTDAVGRSCDLTLLGEAPSIPSDLLSPAGTTIRLHAGRRDWTGEVLSAPAGAYVFDEAGVTRDHLGAVTIVGYDLSWLVQRSRWKRPTVYSGNIATVIDEALNSRLPAHLRQPLNAATTSYTVQQVVWGEERDNDPWDDLRKLASRAGMQLYFDRAGMPTLEPVPDPDTVQPRWDFTAGSELTYLSGAKQLQGMPYNIFVVTGTPPDDQPEVEVEVADEDPHSASYIGLYEAPYFITSTMIATEEQALAAGRGELNRRKGLAEVVTMATLPHPGRTVGQVARAVDADLAIDARYFLDRVTLPLRLGQSSLTTRRRRL